MKAGDLIDLASFFIENDRRNAELPELCVVSLHLIFNDGGPDHLDQLLKEIEVVKCHQPHTQHLIGLEEMKDVDKALAVGATNYLVKTKYQLEAVSYTHLRAHET